MIPGIIASRIGGGAPPGFDIYDQLRLYYKFENNVNDLSGNGFHGTSLNMGYTSSSGGKNGEAGTFDPYAPSRVAIPSGGRTPGDFSRSYWLRPNSLFPPAGVTLIEQDWTGSRRNFQLTFENAGGVAFASGNGGSANDTALGTATGLFTVGWHWLLVTRASNVRKIYIDNVLRATSGTDTYTGGPSGGTSYIGSDGGMSVPYGFDGRIDEVGVWTRELSSDERDWLWNGGAGNFPF